MDITRLGISELSAFLMVFVRTAGIFTLIPVFGSTHVPARARIGMALAMSLIFLPMVANFHPADNLLLFAVQIAREAIVGLVIGFACTAVFSVVDMAGQFIDSQSGFSFASMLDPSNGAQSPVATRFYNLLIILLLFATNAHHVLIRGMADSFTVAPVGEITFNTAVAGGVVHMLTVLFIIAIRISAPVVCAVFLVDVALAITSRVVPQMNVFMVGMPLKLAVAVVGLGLTLAVSSAIIESLLTSIYGQMMYLLHRIV